MFWFICICVMFGWFFALLSGATFQEVETSTTSTVLMIFSWFWLASAFAGGMGWLG